MKDSLIPVSPGFDEPLEMLVTCHERMQAQLETLRRLACWLPDHGVDDAARKAAAAVIRYFDHAAVNHHMDEEQDLFPLLLERVSSERRWALVALIDWVKEDHQRMFAAWDEMKACLERLISDGVVELTEEKVAQFSERYVLHMEREETELFPYAEALLSQQDMESLSLTMSARRRQPAGA